MRRSLSAAASSGRENPGTISLLSVAFYVVLIVVVVMVIDAAAAKVARTEAEKKRRAVQKDMDSLTARYHKEVSSELSIRVRAASCPLGCALRAVH
jgi:hypothetical protein